MDSNKLGFELESARVDYFGFQFCFVLFPPQENNDAIFTRLL